MTILRPRLPVLTLLFTLILLLQTGPTPAATVTTVGAASPEAAVGTLLNSFTTPGVTGGTCNALSGRFQGCPITARLLTRLQSATENGNVISRSQNPPQGVSLSLLDNDGQTAHVNTVWQLGASSYTITFTTVKSSSGWQVDDSFCAGQPNTSIFNPPTGPCPSIPASGPTPASAPTVAVTPTATVVVPGVPATGNAGPFAALTPFLVILALLAALSGLFLSLRSTRSRK